MVTWFADVPLFFNRCNIDNVTIIYTVQLYTYPMQQKQADLNFIRTFLFYFQKVSNTSDDNTVELFFLFFFNFFQFLSLRSVSSREMVDNGKLNKNRCRFRDIIITYQAACTFLVTVLFALTSLFDNTTNIMSNRYHNIINYQLTTFTV